MQSEQHVRRLIRQLQLPDQADLVIQRSKYWSPAFCWLYFARCDELIFDDGAAGLRAAEVAPELVALVCRFSRPTAPCPALQVRALAVLGSAYRVIGELDESEAVYDQAWRIAVRKSVGDVDRANVLFRVAALRSAQARLDEAFESAHRSVALYREADEDVRQQHLGEALIVRGVLEDMAGNYSAAMRDWSEALSCTDPRKSPRVHHCASHNLACSLVERPADPRSLSRVGGYLREARRFLSKRPRSLQKLRLIWLQGMILIRFGSTRRGEAAFRQAREGFIEMGAPFELAMLSLYLGRHLYRSGQASELEALAVETQQVFSALCADRRANQALTLWRDKVLADSASIEVFSTAWQSLRGRMTATSAGELRAVQPPRHSS